MRLRRLWLENFYNLENVELFFNSADQFYGSNSIRFFIGLNGSGKSSALEALGLIFSHLSADAPPGMGFDLEYELRGQIVRITTRHSEGVAPVPPIDAAVFVRGLGEPEWRAEHARQHWASSGELLPRRVVGYASGPTSGLQWALFGSTQQLVKNTLGEFEQEARPEGLTDEEWQKNREAHRDDLRRRIEAYLDNPNAHFLGAEEGVCAILSLMVHGGAAATDPPSYRVQRARLLDRLDLDKEEPLPAFTLRISGSWYERVTPSSRRDRLRGLLRLATVRMPLDQSESSETGEPLPPDFYAVFDIDDALSQDIEAIMGSPLAFFEELLAWRRQGALQELRLVIRKKFVRGLLPLTALSDGEYFLLGRYSLLMMMREIADGLILFDEPETHFNDHWKVDLVKDICELLGSGATGDSTSGHEVVIATHSDLTLTDADPRQVYLFTEHCVAGHDGMPRRAVLVSPPTISPFAASRTEIAQAIFRTGSSIGNYAHQRVEQALRGESAKELAEMIQTAGPGFHRFRLISKLTQLDSPAPEGETNVTSD